MSKYDHKTSQDKQCQSPLDVLTEPCQNPLKCPHRGIRFDWCIFFYGFSHYEYLYEKRFQLDCASINKYYILITVSRQMGLKCIFVR